MATKPNYVKDQYTGAVVFTDANAYSQRKKQLDERKKQTQANNHSRRVINSMKNEINGLKKIVYDLIEDRGGSN